MNARAGGVPSCALMGHGVNAEWTKIGNLLLTAGLVVTLLVNRAGAAARMLA